jgi:hypothetical protein
MKPERRECLQKMKYGAIMGGGVGSAAGFLFGSYEAFRYKGIPASQVRCLPRFHGRSNTATQHRVPARGS